MQLFLFPLTLKFLSPSLILIEIPPTIFGVCRIVVLGKLNTLVKQWIIDTSLAKVGRNIIIPCTRCMFDSRVIDKV